MRRAQIEPRRGETSGGGDPMLDLLEGLATAVALVPQQVENIGPPGLLPRRDLVAPKRIDGARREFGQFLGTGERLERTAVARQHERRRLRSDFELAGNFTERISQAAEDGDLTHALRQGFDGVGSNRRAGFIVGRDVVSHVCNKYEV